MSLGMTRECSVCGRPVAPRQGRPVKVMNSKNEVVEAHDASLGAHYAAGPHGLLYCPFCAPFTVGVTVTPRQYRSVYSPPGRRTIRARYLTVQRSGPRERAEELVTLSLDGTPHTQVRLEDRLYVLSPPLIGTYSLAVMLEVSRFMPMDTSAIVTFSWD